MDKITIEIKEELKLETIIDKNTLNEIVEFFVNDIIIPYIEDKYGYKTIISEALINKLNETYDDDINIGMAKAILKFFEENKHKGLTN